MRTPLHVLVSTHKEAGAVPLIFAMVEAGADVNAAESTASTPLHHAVDRHWYEAAEALIVCGADPTLRNREGQRPVDIAKALGRFSDRDRLLGLLQPRKLP